MMSKNKNYFDLKSVIRQIWKKNWWLILLLLVLVVVPFLQKTVPCELLNRLWKSGASGYIFLCITIILFLVVSLCNTLTSYYSLKKKEKGITWCQITILFAFGLWVLGFLLVFDIHKESRNFLVFGIIGTLLGWIFQDTIKGVVAFIHLRLNHLLEIDDWIAVPGHNVDGEVKHITLTTVTLYNWDTTTSSIPIHFLHSDHFINYQKMTTGKTYGRRMLKTFILDTSWFFQITDDDVERLNKNEELKPYLPKKEIKEGAYNYHLYRLYLYHWLMSHPRVSQQPTLVVRWLDQNVTGFPLQVYAFIMDGGFSAFEWEQSLIVEHIVESLDWFGLRLYQSPSSYDAGNTDIHLTKSAAVYRKEIGL